MFVITCAGGMLRVCLTWTDLPGRGLQNSLALLVADNTTGKRTSGNPRRKKEFDTDDAGNNVQVVRFDDAAAGSYTIQVTAANLLPRSAGTPAKPQHFALVVSGDLDLRPRPALIAKEFPHGPLLPTGPDRRLRPVAKTDELGRRLGRRHRRLADRAPPPTRTAASTTRTDRVGRPAATRRRSPGTRSPW